MSDRQWLSIDFNIAADASDVRYACVPSPGEWKLERAYFVPATTVATHGTAYGTLTLKKGAGGTSLGSLTTNSSGGAAWTAGTPSAFTLADSTDVEFTGGTDCLEITADGTAGTGAAVDGCVVCEFVKLRGA